eukprot:1162110-Pelagomonas_calceolata.AAC.1
MRLRARTLLVLLCSASPPVTPLPKNPASQSLFCAVRHCMEMSVFLVLLQNGRDDVSLVNGKGYG